MQIIWGMYVSWCFHLYCIYHANNWGDVCQLVFSFVIVDIMQTIGRMYVSWCIHWYRIYHANNCGDVCQLVFSFVIVDVMQKILGDVRLVRMSVGIFIGIVYIMLTIGGICVGWWMSVGPFGPRVGAFM